MKSVYRLLEKDHEIALQKLDKFYEVLKKLRGEGKLHRGRNLREVRALAAFFKKEIESHTKIEERVLFPFLQSHIPRMEPMVRLLFSEHEDLQYTLEGIRSALARSRSAPQKQDLIDRICERGTYLICLLRSHLWTEDHSLYKVADKELRPDERARLIRLVRQKGSRR